MVVPWRSATLLAYDISNSVVSPEQPPNVSKTAALNRKPDNTTALPGKVDKKDAAVRTGHCSAHCALCMILYSNYFSERDSTISYCQSIFPFPFHSFLAGELANVR